MSREIAKPEEHLSDESILRLIDGEADPSRVSQIRSHLEACWSCRAREEWLREAIGRFVFYREAVYSPAAQPPPRNWAGFSAKLQQQTEQMETRVTDRLWANLRRFRRFLVPAWAGQTWQFP
jgi:anti-sigma factor RsiW